MKWPLGWARCPWWAPRLTSARSTWPGGAGCRGRAAPEPPPLEVGAWLVVVVGCALVEDVVPVGAGRVAVVDGGAVVEAVVLGA